MLKNEEKTNENTAFFRIFASCLNKKDMTRKKSKWAKLAEQVLVLATCLLVMVVAAIQRDGKVWGHDLKARAQDSTEAKAGSMRSLADGTVVVNTTQLASDIKGYAGPVPLDIYINDGRIVKVEALKNAETPDFFDQAKALLDRWNGKTLEEARQMKVDAVSGATFSSRAIIGSMRRGLQYAADNAVKPSVFDQMDLSAKNVIGLVVVLLGAIVPLFLHHKRWRLVQLALNVVVLGLWCGTFLSWSMFVGYMSGGISVWTSLIPIVMLITAFVYPLFGKKQYYCANICPFGSLQELAGKTTKKHWKMSAATARRLTLLRRALFAVLLVLMLSGVWSAWTDYELFTAFIFKSASVVVIVLAVVFVVLAVFVPRPYCRFVCPTGTLLKAL